MKFCTHIILLPSLPNSLRYVASTLHFQRFPMLEERGHFIKTEYLSKCHLPSSPPLSSPFSSPLPSHLHLSSVSVSVCLCLSLHPSILLCVQMLHTQTYTWRYRYLTLWNVKMSNDYILNCSITYFFPNNMCCGHHSMSTNTSQDHLFF